MCGECEWVVVVSDQCATSRIVICVQSPKAMCLSLVVIRVQSLITTCALSLPKDISWLHAGCIKCVKYLLKAGADVDQASRAGMTALIQSALKNGHSPTHSPTNLLTHSLESVTPASHYCIHDLTPSPCLGMCVICE